MNTLEAIDANENKFMLIVDEDIYRDLQNTNIRVDSWGYPTFGRDNVSWTVARYVMGRASGLLVDHINGNRFDARRVNLRWVNKSQNALNAACHKDNPTGFRGVSRHSNCNKYRARLKVGNMSLVKNGFITPVEAAKQINAWLDEYNVIAPRNIIPDPAQREVMLDSGEFVKNEWSPLK